MASIIKAKIQNASGGGGDSVAEAEEVEKYKLLVTAGPSYDESQHEVVKVNSGEPVHVENEFLRAKVTVRVRGFGGRGLPSTSPDSTPYFNDPSHEKDQYSIGFSFVPKQDLPSVNTVWGNKKLPPGFNTAFKIVKEFIDPGLSCDAYADEPWLYGPCLSCWFAFRIGEKIKEGADFPGPNDQQAMHEGGDGSGLEVRTKHGIPDKSEKRRKFFLDAHHREDFVFEKGRLYEADFYNPYIDFPNFSLKLPGFSLKVIKYIDQQSHCLRYVFKNRAANQVYLNVNFRLLWGEQLQKALQRDRDGKQAGGNGQGGLSQATPAILNGGPQASAPAAPTQQTHNGSRGQETFDRANPGPVQVGPQASAPAPPTQQNHSTARGQDPSIRADPGPVQVGPQASGPAPPTQQNHNGARSQEYSNRAYPAAGQVGPQASAPMPPIQPSTRQNVQHHPATISLDEYLQSNSGTPMASGRATPSIQPQPGDHHAAGTNNSDTEALTRMLKDTSTSDKTGTEERLLGSNTS
ncbi:hypothetical protein LTR48_002362 [Friedmanniomyces endolithicus]|uniref:Domain of unknown function at the cortex 1 domain-containing protein n=1 Tax=Rachicladosporium monterosium TaxID=1507873 RepID=A0ABR0LBF3_9PEZI|nr:hypothetical protein LTS09_000206 [Friedmanniomyces endolithicus]KAK0933980.1 hypothetical protein LTR29_014438 [Friedmanniomyces endolithicus]KAK1093420.1 hypothetical protein LTR48_002362 [Friedmanniomyces endolithicus]KAK5146291.1 hypothetical protein LTR32_002099 [Rachicladosporium monterosium]